MDQLILFRCYRLGNEYLKFNQCGLMDIIKLILGSRLANSGSHQVWVDAAYIKKYSIAIRKCFDTASSISVATDKSTRPGRDCFGGTMCFYEAQKCVWRQPVALLVTSPRYRLVFCVYLVYLGYSWTHPICTLVGPHNYCKAT